MPGRAALIWRVARDPSLRRIELAYGGFSLAEHATWLAVLVYAFSRGGVTETGTAATALLVAAVLAAPFAAYAGDRFRPGRALALGSSVQAITAAATAVGMWFDMAVLAYASAIALSAALTFSRPVVTSLLPVVMRRPGDLVAANVVVGLLSDLGMFIGPLSAAGLMVLGGPETVLGVAAGVLMLGAISTFRVDRTVGSAVSTAAIDIGGLRSELLAGLRTASAEPAVRALLFLLFVGALAAGIVDVLVVSFAEIRLGGGGSQAGLLAAGAGLGAILGSLSASSLIGGVRSRTFLVAGGIAIGVPFALLAGIDRLAVAVALMALIGAGQSMLVVAGTVAIQRRTPGDTLARVFGAAEAVQLLAMAVGAAGVAVLIDRVALPQALVVVALGLLVLLTTAVLWLVRCGADAAPPRADLVQRLTEDPIFAFADLPTIERIANGIREVRHLDGDVVIAEGESGDAYHLLVEGQVLVVRNGEFVEAMGPGTSFGEIALLRDVPRTATITCLTDVSLLSLGRDDFLEIVTGHPRRLAAANGVADTRLARD